MLQDMAILTGGQVISEEVGLKLENVTLDLLGTAKQVIVTKDETTIVEGGGTEDDIKGRINQIKAEIENTDSDYDREKLQERLAKLSGGVAVLKVGAATEVELKEKKHRIEDAVSTTKAAIEEGVVPGGGVSLLRSQAGRARRPPTRCRVTRPPAPASWPSRSKARSSRSPRTPASRAASSSSGSAASRGAEGLNAATGDYEDLVKIGVIDAAKVTRSALQNAASIAALFLTTEAVIADKPEKASPAAHARRRRHGLLSPASTETGGAGEVGPGLLRAGTVACELCDAATVAAGDGFAAHPSNVSSMTSSSVSRRPRSISVSNIVASSVPRR